MKHANKSVKMSFANSLKGLTGIINRKAIKYKQPIAVSQNGIAYYIYPGGKKVQILE